MARQRDRVDVNRVAGEYIGIGSNCKVCYRFGAGQNTRTLIGDGGGVSGGGTYRESRCRVVRQHGRLVRLLRPRGGVLSVRCRGRLRWDRSLSRSPTGDFSRRDQIALLTGIGYQSLFALLSFPYR